MSSDTSQPSHAIHVRGLGKLFELAARQERYGTLRDTLMDLAKAPFRKFASRGADHEPRQLWALRDVSFDVSHGEVVGLVGRNGAGKSTLLKILSRITPPTTGRAEIHGRVGSLLEVGTGFHPELSGRENVFLNGAILGMRKTEIDRQFDDIVAFAELDQFMDTAVKHYSTGMYMRLAFAVSAHMDTEILLVDEVLAVGDAAFQQKCLGKMGEVAAAGRTVIFVSHNMAAVAGLCNRAIWIDHGTIKADGPVDDVTREYLNALSMGSFRCVSRDKKFTVHSVALRDRGGQPSNHLSPGDDLVVDVHYEAAGRIESPFFQILVQSIHGPCFAADMRLDGGQPRFVEGEGRLVCRFKDVALLPQSYTVRMAVKAGNRDPIIDLQEVGAFTVAGDLKAFGFNGAYQSLVAKSVPLVVPYEWTLPDGVVVACGLGRGAEPRNVVRTASGPRD
jgi:lipopolysaccharide transport system ATP-binding protein